MSQRIIIDPVTRIEGHAKISIYLDDNGQVNDARFHVTEFRGFEQFCVGRPLEEMPGTTARICGICPVSHLLTSAKTGDILLNITVPATATKLRRLMNLGQITQSHALSFFHLSGPDLLLGMDSDQKTRNVFGLIASEPDFARKGIRLRQFGQEVIEILGGRRIHSNWAIPGGVRKPLTAQGRNQIQTGLPEAKNTILEALNRFKSLFANYQQEIQSFGNFPSLFMGLTNDQGLWETYEGKVRFVDSNGNIVADGIDPAEYHQFVGEAVQPDSYLKSPYFRPLGYPDKGDRCTIENGMYRVGPLARLNICTRIGTPLADKELQAFREYGRPLVTSSFFYHYARLIEILAAIEQIEILLDDPEILSTEVAVTGEIQKLEAIGVSEAPRGTLFHHYQVDEKGIIQKMNLIIATGQNNLAMNRTVTQIARHFIKGEEIKEGMLNRVEAGIRAFDPCLSCSTHAFGQMPLHIEILASDGTLVNQVYRE
ncbi:MAG TPA: Ni/Fe hydrogenase subunit alpha [Nostocaceae cyanobacterium]|nr:Ni/Fe hydrogenase subunit alpha [Nostocaceae cyanobacterium]